MLPYTVVYSNILKTFSFFEKTRFLTSALNERRIAYYHTLHSAVKTPAFKSVHVFFVLPNTVTVSVTLFDLRN